MYNCRIRIISTKKLTKTSMAISALRVINTIYCCTTSFTIGIRGFLEKGFQLNRQPPWVQTCFLTGNIVQVLSSFF